MNQLNLTLSQLVIMLVPLMILQLTLMGIALYQLTKSNTKYLSKPIWAIIIVVMNILGPILFLLVGRETDDYS